MQQSFRRTRLLNMLKRLYYTWRRQPQLAGTLPPLLGIEATNVCNARCPLCPTGNGELQRVKGMLCLEHFQQVIDEVKAHVVMINLFNYGESFLNPDIFAMIRYAAQ